MEIDADAAFNETDGWSNSLTFAVSMDLLGFAGKLNWKLTHTGRESVEAKKKLIEKNFCQSWSFDDFMWIILITRSIQKTFLHEIKVLKWMNRLDFSIEWFLSVLESIQAHKIWSFVLISHHNSCENPALMSFTNFNFQYQDYVFSIERLLERAQLPIL